MTDDRPASARIPLSPEEVERRRPPPYFAIEVLPDTPRPPCPAGKVRIAPVLRVPRKTA